MSTPAISVEAAVNQAFAAATAPSEPEPAPAAAAAPEPPPETPATPDVEQVPPPEDEGTELLSAEERKELEGKPPEERIKGFQRAFTRKSQELSEQRKSLEQYQQLIQAFEQDPDATIRYLAEQRGLKLSGKEAEAKPDAPQPSADTVKALEEQLGPELAFLAPKLAAAMETMLSKAVTPLAEQHERMLSEQAKQATESVLKAFDSEKPEWRKHEAQVAELMSRYQPAPKAGVDEGQYLRDMYKLASHSISEAEKVKQVAERMEKAAAKSESSGSGVSAQRVSKAAPKFESMTEAIGAALDAARRGEQWE